METLINNLQAWLRRNKPGDPPGTLREPPKRERHWFAAKGSDQPRERAAPCCIYCKEDHWANDCTSLQRWRCVGSSFTTISCATTAGGRDILRASAEVGDATNVKEDIIRVYATTKATLY